jgi:hypothetical protein
MILLILILSLVVIEASYVLWGWYKVGGFSRRYWLMTMILLSVYVPLTLLWLSPFIGFDILEYRYHIFIFWLPCLLYVFLPIMLNILFPPLPFRMKGRFGSEWSTWIVWCLTLLLWTPIVIFPLVLFWDGVNLYERSMAVAAICAGGIGSSLMFVYLIRVVRLNNFDDVKDERIEELCTQEPFKILCDEIKDWWR